MQAGARRVRSAWNSAFCLIFALPLQVPCVGSGAFVAAGRGMDCDPTCVLPVSLWIILPLCS